MKTTPFWHEAAPPEAPSGTAAPARVDVAIAGAGFTGLSCALALAEAGKTVAVYEVGPPGAGASTRNGGMIGWGHRMTVAKLAKRYGADTAAAALAEARASLDYTVDLIGKLPEDARYARTGRFLGAASPRHFEALARWAETEAAALGMEAHVVSTTEQHAHIASDLYQGGVYFPQHGGLHPGLMHRGLLKAARAAGAHIVDHCPITAISGRPGEWQIRHGQGETQAGELVYAANGYTGGANGPFPDFARRLIPIPSYIIATEPLGENRVKSLIPNGSMIVETRAQHSYFRPSPDGERILYGGRASLNVLDEKTSAGRMHDIMGSVFPELRDVALSHSWRGFVAFTFDGIPHAGQRNGVWFACGYNGSGVAMSPYLGWKVAQKILNRPAGVTGFDATQLLSQPFYGGSPWFLSGVELWMKLRDRLQGVAAIPKRG